jgi:hypothetical protein
MPTVLTFQPMVAGLVARLPTEPWRKRDLAVEEEGSSRGFTVTSASSSQCRITDRSTV